MKTVGKVGLFSKNVGEILEKHARFVRIIALMEKRDIGARAKKEVIQTREMKTMRTKNTKTQ